VADIFVSYKAEDRARVAPLVKALEAEGLRVWWDAQIGGGEDWRASIQQNLEAARVVIVVWSARSVAPEGRFVRDEASWAQRRGSYLPVKIDAVPPPLGFGEIQALPLTGWKGARSDARYQAVRAAVLARLDREAAAPAPPATKGLDRRLLLGGGALLAAGAGFGAWRLWGGGDDGAAGDATSIAVLPFANLSGDPGQAFFSDGLAEELRTALAQVPEVRVIGRVSSEKFRDTDDLKGAAEQLGVATILTGSVRRSPSTIRIAAQLIDGKTGVERWSQTYDRAPGDVIAVQSSIATAVVAALSPQLGRQVGTVTVGGTRNAEAQALFLRQRQLGITSGSEESVHQRIALLDAAIALDPDFAEATATKGAMLNVLGTYEDQPTAELQAQARTLINRAIRLAPDSAFVRSVNSDALMGELDIRDAVAETERALKLNSNDVRVLSTSARTLSRVYPDRGVALARAALARDPFNSASQTTLSDALHRDRRYREALTAADAALAMSDGTRGDYAKVVALVALGDLPAARAAAASIDRDWQQHTATAIIEAKAGNRDASDAAMAALEKLNNDTLFYQLMQVRAQRGETAAALEALDKALATRDPGMQSLLTDPLADPLRSEARFQAVLAKLFPADAIAAQAQRSTA
jgi:serine/threonine-protein kinase